MPNIVPIEISARHVHLSSEHLGALFGKDYALQKHKDLSQPGQFAAVETVAIVGPKSQIAKVRIIGPCRTETQVEVSLTDARALGIAAEVRKSGDLAGSRPIKITGPQGSIELSGGLIIPERHLHIDPRTASAYNLQEGDLVGVAISGIRALIFQNVIVRIGEQFTLSLQIDTDEANAAGISPSNCQGQIITPENL
jgi:putative phosphotransacetylase